MKNPLRSIIPLLALGIVSGDALPEPILLGATQYRSFDDSPFAPAGSHPLPGIFLEDFEDGLFNTPGVTGISNTPGTSLGVGGGGFNTDSVDGDSGPIDGFGRDGQALSEANNRSTDNLGYTFEFDPSVLGGLPTHAGIVWTDGSFSAPTQVEFFGPGGVSLGVIGPVHISDNSFSGGTAEDHFFGAVNLEGIESFTIRSPGGGNNLTVDHLQYGLVPEPASAALLAAGTLFIVRRRRS